MSWDNCKVCGKSRKVDVIWALNGWLQPACYQCGDPAYVESHEEDE